MQKNCDIDQSCTLGPKVFFVVFLNRICQWKKQETETSGTRVSVLKHSKKYSLWSPPPLINVGFVLKHWLVTGGGGGSSDIALFFWNTLPIWWL